MKRMQSRASAGVAFAILLSGLSTSSAQSRLGTAQNFAVLGASTVTNTGSSVVTGNLGLSPGTAVTGFPPGLVIGTTHIGDAVAIQAQNDATTAYNAFANVACGVDLTGQDLGGLTLAPGVYCFSSSAQLTGLLTLDAMGNPSASFVFQIGTSLTTASNSSVRVINGASGCNVYWQVGSSATLGTSSVLVGNVLALASVTLTTNVRVSGSILALTGAVTLDSNLVTIPVECQCTTTATVTDLGPGCGVPTAPVLSSTPFVPGSMATLHLTSAFPAAVVTFFKSDCGAPTYIVPGSSCPIYLGPSAVDIFRAVTDSAGNWTLSYAVPPNPALVGYCFVLQGLVSAPGGPLGGFHLTSGVQISIGCN